ncbi:MAG: dihydrofolate reductase [Burkholderiales bacterium]|nr:dihydrofolate reductase [Burkholderiales bacterium]
MPKPLVSLISSVARDGGIGRANDLLVRLPGDLPRFKQLTMGAPIVMGRKNWDSLPRRPLPGRRNIVVTRDPAWHADGAERAASLEEGLALAGDVPRVFVIGGAEIFALALPLADELELTEIDAEFPADTFFPPWNRADFRQTAREAHATPEGLRYSFATYRRNASGE